MFISNSDFRDHLLQHVIIDVLTKSKNTLEMFEENSFFRDEESLYYIVHILDSLNEFEIVLENSLTYGIIY